LTDLLPADGSASRRAVALTDGTPVVVLRRSGPDRIEVIQGGDVLDLADSTPATAISDIDRAARLIGQALQSVSQHRHYQQQEIQRLRDDSSQLRDTVRDTEARHAATLGDIRRYAIDRHRAGDICRDGLDAFLTYFGMPTYQSRLKVTFEITGSYEVDADDEDEVRRTADDQIYLDLASLDGFVVHSDDYTLTITSIQDATP
jgi:hypothetical protein